MTGLNRVSTQAKSIHKVWTSGGIIIGSVYVLVNKNARLALLDLDQWSDERKSLPSGIFSAG